jgi:hypothetical protein
MFTNIWAWLKSRFAKGKTAMTDAFTAAENSVESALDTLATDIKAEVVRVQAELAPAVSTAGTDVDAVLTEVKKLLDFYGHDVPTWAEITALAKKL